MYDPIACTFDLETTVGTYLGRKGSPFSDGGINLCSSGFLFDDGEYQDAYHVRPDAEGILQGTARGSDDWRDAFPDLTGIDVLVGHNIKFDLLWYWRHPRLEEFLARGGRIWDTAYAEYLLSGQFYNLAMPEHLRPSLRDSAKRRGLTLKLDVVKAMWDKGIRTEDIPEDVLLEYQHGDCITTQELFRDQLAQAERQTQTHMIIERMDGLLATTEMEFNGLKIDLDKAKVQQEALEDMIEELREQLQVHIPTMPAELEFNWASPNHLSALLFGGKLKYKKKADILDDEGNQTYYKTKVKTTVYKGGKPVIFKSGKNKGKVKTKLVDAWDYERGPKQKLFDFIHELPGVTKPHHAWKSSVEGRWSTKAKVLETLQKRGLPLVDDLLALRGAEKDLGTYYRRFNKGKWTGMLTMVDEEGFVHHNLNHFTTKTTRLSAERPNLQNLPGKGKSDVRDLFISRFGAEGRVCEGDYSQLEVVCKAVLSGDKELMRKLAIGLCLHCDWLSQMPFANGKSYEEIYKLCKVDHDPEWQAKRKRVKPITFGEAYGAGISSLAAESGLDAEVIADAIAKRRETYPDVYKFDDDNIESVKRSRRPSQLRTEEGMQAGIGYLRCITDTIYHFIEGDSPDWMRHKGIMTSFTPTTIKNYPSQGLGGEIMQVAIGRIFRWLLSNNRFDDLLLMINTVHDCVWFDYHVSVEGQLGEAKRIMEDVSPYFSSKYPRVQWDTEFPAEFEIGPSFGELEILH